jgi:hypothetical protein
MKIYGLDFTSAPRPRKPITVVEATWSGRRLTIRDELIRLTSFAAFEHFLTRPGPWLAGFDFPFGQPRRLIRNLGWPERWADYVAKIGAMSPTEFEETLAAYRHSRPPGDKHHRRRTDLKANARSPMMLFGVPVGKMFFQGAPRLLQAGVSVLPCHPTGTNRIAVEIYPALAARRWVGARSYKHEAKKKQTAEREAARRDIIKALNSRKVETHYGFSLQMSQKMANACLADPTGDTLDAMLAALQTGWAYRQRAQNYGLPPDCDPVEGWIIDLATG